MMNKYLTADIHFHTAAIDRLPVSAFQDGEYLGCGPIDAITEDAIVIGGFHYVRSACTFATLTFLVTEYGVAGSEWDEMSPADIDFVTEEFGGKLNVINAVNGKRYVPHFTVDKMGKPMFPVEYYAILSSKLRMP